MKAIFGLGALIAGVTMTTMAAAAVEKIARFDAKRDWSVFANEGGEKMCWIVTQPTTSLATRGGKPVEVRRSDIYMMVAVIPGQGVKNEVSVVSGYPYRKGGTVSARIGSSSFEMFTENEGAWLATKEDDAKMVTAMKRGATAVVTGVSSRGTTTVDTFSLLGFTAALESAAQKCR